MFPLTDDLDATFGAIAPGALGEFEDIEREAETLRRQGRETPVQCEEVIAMLAAHGLGYEDLPPELQTIVGDIDVED